MSPSEPAGHPDYLKPQGSLQPANAAVALIVDQAGRYLVQLRDAKPTIFFPQHWGCFGGAVEPGETDDDCLARELQEELDLDLSRCTVRHFTTFTFDFGFAGGSVIHRAFYEVRAAEALLARLKLAEGQAMQLFPGRNCSRCRSCHTTALRFGCTATGSNLERLPIKLRRILRQGSSLRIRFVPKLIGSVPDDRRARCPGDGRTEPRAWPDPLPAAAA